MAIEKIADLVESAFEAHYIRTSPEPNEWQSRLWHDRESTYEWEREGYPVLEAIEEATSITGQALEDILSILANRHDNFDWDVYEETEFSGDSYYQNKSVSDNEWQSDWLTFERMLKTEARFFNRVGAEFLGSLFNDIDKKQTRFGKSVVIQAGPETELKTLYRARVFQSRESLEKTLSHPEVHLGPPPPNFAKGGRMNAHGISVFYGADRNEIALAEVRPPVGSHVVVAKFEVIRLLRLLDISALEDIYESGSVFDPSYAFLLSKAKFLRSLKEHIVRPVMPDDELTEYLTTQAVADFLATEVSPPLDGIIFPSVQTEDEDGFNVVLFHKASTVEEIKLPKGAIVNVSTGYETEDGWEDDFSAYVTKPKNVSQKHVTDQEIEFVLMHLDGEEPEFLENPALRIDLDEIEIHIVSKISVTTTKRSFSWHQDPDDEPEP